MAAELAPAPPAETPSDEAALAGLIKDAAAAGAPVELLGGGTRRALGRPVQADRAISLKGVSGVDLYEPGALTLVVKAGTPLAEVDAALAAEGQQLSFEPMDHRALLKSTGEPTIGGVVACAVAGPRRIQAGGCRDSLIGVRFVNGAGEAVSSGGRVMKNVTGYDLVKLMAGSFGTLGALTQLSFKVLPKPETTGVLRIHGLDDGAAVDALSAALGSPYDVTGAAHLPAGQAMDGEAAVTLVRLEGFADSVAYRAGKLRDLIAARLGDKAGPIDILDDPGRAAALWRYVRDVGPFHDRDGAVWRLSVKPTDGPVIAAAIRAALPETDLFYDWGGGLMWVRTPAQNDAGAVQIRAAVAETGGAATLVRAEPATRAAIDVFPPQAAGLAALSQGLRAKFDPMGVLNPGRMSA